MWRLNDRKRGNVPRHLCDHKVVGSAYKDIAARYAGQKASKTSWCRKY